MAYYHPLCGRLEFLAAVHRLYWRSIAIQVGWVVVGALLSLMCLAIVIASAQPASSHVPHVQTPFVRLHLARRRTPVGPVSVRSSSIVRLEYWR